MIDAAAVIARLRATDARSGGRCRVRRSRVTFDGTAGHAGALPMGDRRDPVRAAARFILEIFDPALARDAAAVTGGGSPLVSGPLHDSAALAQAGIPAVMLFVSSTGGISHARAEDKPEPHLAEAVSALHRLVAKTLGD